MPFLSIFALCRFNMKGAPIGAPIFLLAAAAAIVIAAAVVAVPQGAAAAIAEQDDQQDDPAQIATAEIIVTHIRYLQKFIAAEPLIPCYSTGLKMCGPEKLTPGISCLIINTIFLWR